SLPPVCENPRLPTRRRDVGSTTCPRGLLCAIEVPVFMYPPLLWRGLEGVLWTLSTALPFPCQLARERMSQPITVADEYSCGGGAACVESIYTCA
uniref:Uncharacterized protein n=1 Tax=Scophthalmus maximus TaxID=52904 RepID=A0A8D3AFH0_SCOMX